MYCHRENRDRHHNNNWRNNNSNHQGRRHKPKNYFVRNLAKEAQIENLEKTQLLNPVKEQLIDYVYKSVNLSKYKYKLIEYETDLPLLKEKKFFVSPNYNGIQGLLIFKKIKDKYYSLIMDRRTLKYNREEVDIDSVKLIPISARLDETIYNGTIIDGVLLYNHMNGIKNFVINDIYIFRGKDLSNDKINDKMININTYLEQFMKQDDKMNNILFIVNKLYNLYELKQLAHMYIPSSKYNTCVKGLSFFPEISGYKLIYLYNNCAQGEATANQTEPEAIIKEKPSHTQLVIKPTQKLLKGAGMAVLRMKKTGIVDVYHLYGAKKVVQDGRSLLKFKKLGLAYLPTTETSQFCMKLFEDRDEDDSILVECKYVPDKNKWIPIKLAQNFKRPDYFEHLNLNKDVDSD